MVAELGDHDVRHQRLGGHAAVEQPVWCGSLHDGPFAGATAIARPPGHPHPQSGGEDVQLLGPVLADQVQGATAAGAGLVLDIDHHLVARQMRG